MTERPAIRVRFEGGQIVNQHGTRVDVCRWCGCVHTYFCPRIKAVTYYPATAGQELGAIEHIEFWDKPSEELWGNVVELEEAPDTPGV